MKNERRKNRNKETEKMGKTKKLLDLMYVHLFV